ncbi:MAG: LysR family transcriptional regulator [Pseudomonadota bacterium]
MEWTIDRMKQFVATAEAGSISAAARRLGKAQSAVSTAIGLLEADLGFELFDRSRRNVQLTPAGEVMLLEARELLRQAEGLDQRALSLAGGQQAKLSLALDEALPYLAVGALVKEISEHFPSLELTLLNGTATEVAEYVEKQRASVAFHFDRGPSSLSFAQKHIGSVPQGIFVGRGHPLTKIKKITQRDLAKHRQLLMHMDDFSDPALSPSVWRSDSFYSIAAMAADRIGWAILPLNIAEYEEYRLQLQELPCEEFTLPVLSVRMLWLQGHQPDATTQWVQKRLAELLHTVL